MIRLGILGSTRGSHLDAIVNAIRRGELSASIEIVISNKSTAPILERAASLNLLNKFVDPTGLSRESFDSRISEMLIEHDVELIILMGYMRILSPEFIARWKNKIINVHPSLLPLHAGEMDMDVHRAVIAAGEKESGCSVHYVTEEVDAGPVIIQKKCEVDSDETAESLKAKVQALEAEALIEMISRLG